MAVWIHGHPLLPELRPQHPRVAAHRRVAGLLDPVTRAGPRERTAGEGGRHLGGGRSRRLDAIPARQSLVPEGRLGFSRHSRYVHGRS